jgi:hypothetical protein
LVLSLLTVVLAQPKAVVERTILEVGKVKKGQVIVAEFRIRNEGTEVLRIESLTPA